MRIRGETAIDCTDLVNSGRPGDFPDARLLENGFLAVLYQHYRRSQTRAGKVSENRGADCPEDGK